MSNFEDAVIQRIKQLEREVERLQKWERAADLGLGKLSDPNADRVLFWDESAGALKWLTLGTGLTITDTTIKPSQPQFYPLSTPLTSTSWDGDAYSSNATATLIDLSAAFGVPAGIKAIAVRVAARDSAAFGTGGLYFNIGPRTDFAYALTCYPLGGDIWNTTCGVCPCNSDGDIYYRINASGTSTLDAILQITGYWL